MAQPFACSGNAKVPPQTEPTRAPVREGLQPHAIQGCFVPRLGGWHEVPDDQEHVVFYHEQDWLLHYAGGVSWCRGCLFYWNRAQPRVPCAAPEETILTNCTVPSCSRWCRRWCQRRFQNCCAGANQHRQRRQGLAAAWAWLKLAPRLPVLLEASTATCARLPPPALPSAGPSGALSVPLLCAACTCGLALTAFSSA